MNVSKSVKSLTELLQSQRDLHRRVKIEHWKRMPKSEQEQIIKLAKEKLPKYHINRETHRLETMA